MKYLKNLLTITIVTLVSAGVSVFFYSSLNKKQEIKSISNIQTPVQYSSFPVGEEPINFTYAAELSVNAVVHVMTKYETKQASVGSDPFFEFFFGERRGFQQPQPRIGSGSGVILSSDGYIVTNNHVIEGSNEISVILNDKRTFKATLVGADPSTDLALLKIEALDLPTLAIGNSDDLKIGEWVLAVGNPFNLTSTVTAGIVSAKARNINILNADMKIESFIQTDAAVNPGNSGGALVNTKGQLVGINTAIASQTGSYAGYSFAIPVSIMSKIVADLKEFGIVQRALLGVVINDITAEFAKEKDIETLEGVYVAEVNDNSAAIEAGIKKGDVITQVNDVKVKSVSELQEQIGRFSPGNKVKIYVIRNNKKEVLDVILKNKMGNTNIVKEIGIEDLGATLVPITDKEKRKLGISSGLQVKKVEKGGKFNLAGIPQGYIIVKINNRMVNSISDIDKIIKDIKQNNNKFNEQALFISGLNPDGKIIYFAVDLN